MKFALKQGLFCKLIVGYKNENYRSNKEVNNKKIVKNLKTDNSKNISRNFSGALEGSVGSVQFQIVTCSSI